MYRRATQLVAAVFGLFSRLPSFRAGKQNIKGASIHCAVMDPDWLMCSVTTAHSKKKQIPSSTEIIRLTASKSRLCLSVMLRKKYNSHAT
jgi:hypothetical protein